MFAQPNKKSKITTFCFSKITKLTNRFVVVGFRGANPKKPLTRGFATGG